MKVTHHLLKAFVIYSEKIAIHPGGVMFYFNQ